MSDFIVPNNICCQTNKKLAILNAIGALLKGVLTVLRALNFVHAKTSLRARSSPCAQFVGRCLRSKKVVGSHNYKSTRVNFCYYFNTPYGAVPWKDKFVQKLSCIQFKKHLRKQIGQKITYIFLIMKLFLRRSLYWRISTSLWENLKRLGLLGKTYLSTINPFQLSVAIIQKPVHRFEVQINWLVSI